MHCKYNELYAMLKSVLRRVDMRDYYEGNKF